MRIPTLALSLIALALVLGAPADAAETSAPVHHEITVGLDPESHRVELVDEVTLPDRYAGQRVELLLSERLEILDSEPALERFPDAEVEGFVGINGDSSSLAERGAVARYAVTLGERPTLKLRAAGPIDFALSDEKEQYTRGFRDTPGYVGPEGAYLAGSSLWLPFFGDALVTFELEASGIDAPLPEGWHLISQGDGTSRDENGRARWSTDFPMDEVYLVGGPLRRWSSAAGAVDAQVYLHEDDAATAQKYLTATAQYLEMYRELIGPYPYSKFALVENFWETGFGMPSFTLLGPQIIRFPFILRSSYPHEILHNWWGNGVFVDYETGNWAEGLTAYLADHLLKEQIGQGLEHRRDTLKKYRDYVKDARDFPLVEFRSRHSAATEAVGYGKTAMGFHMLRRELGDDVFREALQRLWRDQRGQRASFADVRAAFEAASERDLDAFFVAWTERAGAAALRLSEARAEPDGNSWQVTGTLVQEQEAEPFRLQVPLWITTEAGGEWTSVEIDGRSTEFSVATEARPLLLEVDPAFDLFRQLDVRETAPSIGQIFGEPEIVVVLPSAAPAELLEGYRSLVDAWTSGSHALEAVLDEDIETLPDDRAVWLFGRENRFAAELFASDPDLGLEVSAEELGQGGQAVTWAGHSTVTIRRHPGNEEKALGWITVDPAAAFPGMARKLPHYGKYSYLAFEGNEPTNVVKGEWPTPDSPLRVDLRPSAERGAPVEPAPLPEREALIELPPVFSEDRLLEHVTWLADPARQGRGIGTEGLEQAADWVAERFAEAGLRPGGTDGWFQRFDTEGPDGETTVRNVVGVLPGADPKIGEQAVLITAHYDHLGRGWPEARAAERGKLHLGADDNASGVAVMIELAAAMAAGEAPPRTVVFVAFTAEEAGLLGARHWVGDPTPVELDDVYAVVNLDTVGRLGEGPLQVLATGSTSEWVHVVRGVGFVTGVTAKSVPGSGEASDQQAFLEQGIPAIQIFTGPHEDYHRSSDTLDDIDAAGMVRVATFVQETVAYLVERPEPLTVTIAGSESESAPAPSSGRRVSFGIVPSFGAPGPGVLADSIVEGSPAAAAGLLAGDRLVAIDGEELADLRAFSDALKRLEPGQTVNALIDREGERFEVEVTLVTR